MTEDKVNDPAIEKERQAFLEKVIDGEVDPATRTTLFGQLVDADHSKAVSYETRPPNHFYEPFRRRLSEADMTAIQAKQRRPGPSYPVDRVGTSLNGTLEQARDAHLPTIVRAAKENGVDPALMASILDVEAGFDGKNWLTKLFHKDQSVGSTEVRPEVLRGLLKGTEGEKWTNEEIAQDDYKAAYLAARYVKALEKVVPKGDSAALNIGSLYGNLGAIKGSTDYGKTVADYYKQFTDGKSDRYAALQAALQKPEAQPAHDGDPKELAAKAKLLDGNLKVATDAVTEVRGEAERLMLLQSLETYVAAHGPIRQGAQLPEDVRRSVDTMLTDSAALRKDASAFDKRGVLTKQGLDAIHKFQRDNHLAEGSLGVSTVGAVVMHGSGSGLAEAYDATAQHDPSRLYLGQGGNPALQAAALKSAQKLRETIEAARSDVDVMRLTRHGGGGGKLSPEELKKLAEQLPSATDTTLTAQHINAINAIVGLHHQTSGLGSYEAALRLITAESGNKIARDGIGYNSLRVADAKSSPQDKATGAPAVVASAAIEKPKPKAGASASAMV